MTFFQRDPDAHKVRRDMIIKYKRVFGSEEGKEVLNDLMKSGKVFGSTFDNDPIEMAYNEGMRDIVMRIFRTVTTNDEYMERLQKMSETEVHYEV